MKTYNRKLMRFIRKNFDYNDYIYTSLSYLPTNNTNEIRICCPFCNENDYKMYVNDDKKYFNCFKCEASNRHYDVFSFVSECENISIRDAIDKLCSEFKDITPEELAYEDDEDENSSQTLISFKNIKYIEQLPHDCITFKEINEESKPFVDYLFSRGLSFQDILDCNMSYVPKPFSFVYKEEKRVGNIGHRVVWPIYGGNGGLVSWVARSINPNLPSAAPKYLNSLGSDLSKTVWPFVPPLGSELVVVEGIIDALAVRKAGYYSYATFGKKLSEEQIDLFKSWNVESVIIFLDNNAKKEMISLINKIRLIFNNIYVINVANWPKDEKGEIKDSGSMLTYPQGTVILQNSLENKINIKNELEYYKWQIM